MVATIHSRLCNLHLNINVLISLHVEHAVSDIYLERSSIDKQEDAGIRMAHKVGGCALDAILKVNRAILHCCHARHLAAEWSV